LLSRSSSNFLNQEEDGLRAVFFFGTATQIGASAPHKNFKQ